MGLFDKLMGGGAKNDGGGTPKHPESPHGEMAIAEQAAVEAVHQTMRELTETKLFVMGGMTIFSMAVPQPEIKEEHIKVGDKMLGPHGEEDAYSVHQIAIVQQPPSANGAKRFEIRIIDEKGKVRAHQIMEDISMGVNADAFASLLGGFDPKGGEE